MKKKLKDILKESNVWDRKFGESLPTLKDTAARYAAKQKNINEGSSKYKHSTKLIAHRMKTQPGAAKGWFGESWAKALLKKYPNGVSEYDLQMDLPDYVSGSAIAALFTGLKEEGKVNEAFEGMTGIVQSQVLGKGQGFRTSPKKQIKEVGNAQVHKKYILKIEDGAGYLESAVKNYSDFLKQQGNKREAQELRGKYSFVDKFHHWMKTKWVQILRKLI